jgi:hypothetical protein
VSQLTSELSVLLEFAQLEMRFFTPIVVSIKFHWILLRPYWSLVGNQGIVGVLEHPIRQETVFCPLLLWLWHYVSSFIMYFASLKFLRSMDCKLELSDTITQMQGQKKQLLF